jgi:phage-related tail fiber protein
MATIDIRGATLSTTDPPVATNPNPDLAIKAPVRAATTGGSIVLAGLQTVDGVALSAGDRVLVKDQADATTNGLYSAATGAWTRTIDAQNNSQWAQGVMVLVTQGLANAGNGANPTLWVMTAPDPVALGATALTWRFKG